MKIVIATAFSVLLLGTALTPAIADDSPQQVRPNTEWAMKENSQQQIV